tara:strand:+ start:4037 stop:4237 length:201 start_codon:yes stop_codon:yes gene_type:complete
VRFLVSLEDLASFESSLAALISSFEDLLLGRTIRADPYDLFIANILNPSEKTDHQSYLLWNYHHLL